MSTGNALERDHAVLVPARLRERDGLIARELAMLERSHCRTPWSTTRNAQPPRYLRASARKWCRPEVWAEVCQVSRSRHPPEPPEAFVISRRYWPDAGLRVALPNVSYKARVVVTSARLSPRRSLTCARRSQVCRRSSSTTPRLNTSRRRGHASAHAAGALGLLRRPLVQQSSRLIPRRVRRSSRTARLHTGSPRGSDARVGGRVRTVLDVRCSGRRRQRLLALDHASSPWSTLTSTRAY
jgi:hypothetical protein